MHFISEYLNLTSYSKALELMEEKITDAVQQKICYVYGLEHETIYTSGLKTLPEHILKNIIYIKSRRGGSITVHNPGQLILYSVFPIIEIKAELEKYIRVLEKSMIKTLSYYGITSFQDHEHTGVWTSRGKIGFVGIGAKKGVIYHGASLNVCNNLEDYSSILSCGLDLPITRMMDEEGIKNQPLILSEIFKIWLDNFVLTMKMDFNL